MVPVTQFGPLGRSHTDVKLVLLQAALLFVWPASELGDMTNMIT